MPLWSRDDGTVDVGIGRASFTMLCMATGRQRDYATTCARRASRSTLVSERFFIYYLRARESCPQPNTETPGSGLHTEQHRFRWGDLNRLSAFLSKFCVCFRRYSFVIVAGAYPVRISHLHVSVSMMNCPKTARFFLSTSLSTSTIYSFFVRLLVLPDRLGFG